MTRPNGKTSFKDRVDRSQNIRANEILQITNYFCTPNILEDLNGLVVGMFLCYSKLIFITGNILFDIMNIL